MGALDLYKFCPIFGIRNLLLYTIICQPQHSPGHSLEKFVGIPNYGQHKPFFLKIHSSIKFSFKLVLKKCTMYLWAFCFHPFIITVFFMKNSRRN